MLPLFTYHHTNIFKQKKEVITMYTNNKFYRSFKQIAIEDPELASAIKNCFEYYVSPISKPIYSVGTDEVFSTISDLYAFGRYWISYPTIVKSCVQHCPVMSYGDGMEFQFIYMEEFPASYWVAWKERKHQEKIKAQNEKKKTEELEAKLSAIQELVK